MSAKPNIVEHLGNVTEVTSNNIRISITSYSACSACHAKTACSMSETVEKILDYIPSNQKFMVGEQVKVILKQTVGFKAAILAYIVPFLILLSALIVLKSIHFSDGHAGLISILLLAPYYIMLYLIKNKLTKTFSFEVEKIN